MVTREDKYLAIQYHTHKSNVLLDPCRVYMFTEPPMANTHWDGLYVDMHWLRRVSAISQSAFIFDKDLVHT